MATQSPPDEQHRDDDFTQSTEQTPLISGPQTQAVVTPIKPAEYVFKELFHAVPTLRRPGVIIIILCTIIFFASASGSFQNISMTKIFEEILCRQYYDQCRNDNTPIDENMCKVDTIQSKLAYLFDIQASLTAGVSIFAALPWGRRLPLAILGLRTAHQ
ncbi:hypothetical protein GGR58DRAFT_501671 [Xylaria digitata]|nr:hypothetical protein GGR58DRAFT_501671 [Xylaria digitata]